MQNNILKLSKLTLAMGAMGLMACNDATLADQSSIAPQSIVSQDMESDIEVRAIITADDSNDSAMFGVGYDVQSDLLKATNVMYVAQQADGTMLGDIDGNGVDDGATRMGNSNASFSFSVDKGYEDTLNMLQGSGSISAELPAISASGSAELALSSSATSNSTSYTLFARVTPQKAVWLPEEIAAGRIGSNKDLQPTTAMTDWFDYLNEDTDLMKNKVGEEFIQAVEYGAWMMVNLKFEFLNSEDKMDISGKLTVGYKGVVEVSAGGGFGTLDRSETVKVTFTATQFGGDAQELVNVVPVGLLACNLNAPEVCLNAFEDAIIYMTGRDADGEPTGVGFVNQFENNSNYNPTRFFTRRYDESGPTLSAFVGEQKPERTFAAEVALREMFTLLSEARLDRKRSEYLLNQQSAYLTSSQETDVSAIKTASGQNINTLTNTIETCRASIVDTACETGLDAIQLISYDTNKLEIQ